MANLTGTDIACVSDLEYSMGLVSGRTALAQAIARRITTQPGSLWYDPDYGFDVRELIGLEVDNTAVIAAGIEREILKDERVDDVTVVATFASETVTIAIYLTVADGPFDFTLAVSQVAVALEIAA